MEGKLMSKYRISLATLLASSLVAGCTSDNASVTGSDDDAVADEPVQESIEFADWVPERGPTDRHAPDFELFNLCDEAPDSVWEKAGLHYHPGRSETMEGGNHFTCILGKSDNKHDSLHRGSEGSLTVTVDDYSQEELQNQGEIITPPINSAIPGIHFREIAHTNECTAGFETINGRINVGDSGRFRGLTFEESCETALEDLKAIVLK